MLKAAAPAFAAQVAPIRQRLLAGTVIGSDETRFRVGKDNWWLWVFQNPDSCYFIMAPGRGKDVVAQFLDGVRPPAWLSDRLACVRGHWAYLASRGRNRGKTPGSGAFFACPGSMRHDLCGRAAATVFP